MGTGDTPDQAAPFDSFYLLSMGDSEIVDTIDIIGLERDAIPIFFTKMEYIANSMTCSPRPQKENRSPHPPLVSFTSCNNLVEWYADNLDGTKKVAKTPQNPLFEKKSKTFGIGMLSLFCSHDRAK
jgi:hypothetical protein